ncbi:MAG: hypothetical protein HQK72_12360 [Desulfamplus sp.]|nr:hypothetical protein [Desulfamplus sp.]
MEEYLNEALVDYSGIAKTVNDLLSRFTILQFLDFCSLVEGIVLYDRLIMVGGVNSKVGVPNDNIEDRWNEGLKLFLDEKVIVKESQRSSPLNIGQKPDRNQINRDSNYSLGYTLVDAWYETGRLLGAEKLYRKASLPLLRQKPFYEKSAHVIEDHSICDLFGKYKNLKEVLSTIRKSSILTTIQYISVPIPPLPLLVIQHSNSVHDLLRSTLEIRHEYSKLRLSLSALRQTLADLTIPPNEKLKAISSWTKAWSTLSKYENQASFFEMAAASNNMLDVTKSLDGIGLDSFKWSKIIEMMIGKFEKTFYEWKIRQLHKSAKHYISIPESMFASEIKRLFGYQVTKSDINVLRQAGIEI